MQLTMIPDGPAAFVVQKEGLLAGRVFHVHPEGWDWKLEWSDDGSTVLSTQQVLTMAENGNASGRVRVRTPDEAFKAMQAGLAFAIKHTQ